MRFFREHPLYPKDRDLVRVVNAAASRVQDRLLSLDAETLDVSPSTERVLRGQPETLISHIHRCAHVFAWALPSDDVPFSNLSLVAFGDGIGVLSQLAKECSIGTVVYTDPDDAVCRDARIIAETIDSGADHYVYGDIEDVRFYVKRKSIPCDVFVSCDGMERIEKPRTFFDTLYELSDTDFSFGLSKRTCTRGREKDTTDPSTLLNEMVLAGFRVELLIGRRVRSTRTGGAPFAIGSVAGSIFLDRLVDLAAVFASRRSSERHLGATGSVVLFGNRLSAVCGHTQPARHLLPTDFPLITSEIPAG